MNQYLKRTWAEINLDAVEYNYNLIRGLLNKNTKMMCVVKADAYGHGVEFVAREYDRLGADWFAVSNIDEAVQLRSYGIDKPVLILGYTPPELADVLAENNLTQSVYSFDFAKSLSASAQKSGVCVSAHIKVDTGMGRIGFQCSKDESVGEILEICKMQGLDCNGIFTHFAVADEGYAGKSFTLSQYESFTDMIRRIEDGGKTFELRHCCNSAATIVYPEMQLDMVRPGIILYGLAPSPKVKGKIPLKPVMELKTVISMLKEIDEGNSISYGRTFFTERKTRVATVPIGYADGYPRSLSGKQDMLVSGKRASVIGRVCMDQLMLDVTDIPEAIEGMSITVFGTENGSELSVDELAEQSATINYELVCLVGKRVPRIYIKNGESIGRVNYIVK